MPVSRGEQSFGEGWSAQRGDGEKNAEKKTASQDPYAPQTTGQDYYGPDVIAMATAAIAIPLWLTYTFATTNEKVAVIVVAWVISVFLMLTRPYFGLVLFVGLLYVRPEEAFPVLNGLHLALVTSITTLIGTLGMKVLKREKAIVTPLNGMICGFGVIVVLSTLGGSLTSDAVQDMIKLIALVLLIVNLVRTRVQYQGLVTAILIFTAYLACYSIYLYLQGGGIKDHDVMRSQATGIFGDPNDLAAAIDAGLALCLARVASARPSMRLLYLAASGLMIAAVVLTNSRGGLLALIVVIGAFLLVFTRGKVGALFLALVIAVGMIKFGPSRLAKIDRDEESANSRLVFWANGVDQLIQHPLTGVGYGNFYNFNGGMTAHNSFVLCFAELGLPGYFCWMGCLYYCFQSVPKPRKTEKETSKELSLKEEALKKKLERDDHFYDRNGARLAVVGYLAAAFWLSRTYVPNLYLLIGLCVAQQMSATPQLWEWKRTNSEQKRDWQILLALVLVTISVIGILSNRFK